MIAATHALLHAPLLAHINRCPHCHQAMVTRTPVPPIVETLRPVREMLLDELAGGVEDAWRILSLLFGAETYFTIAALGHALNVRYHGLAGRFARAGIPTPKTYLVGALLVRVAALGIDTRASAQRISDELGAATPQSLSRTLRIYHGMPLGAVRRHWGFDGARAHFHATLIAPYRDALRRSVLLPLGVRQDRVLEVTP